jgi:hypothetical protein
MRDMNRRLALTVAGSSTLVVVTAVAAVAANLGILSASPSSGVGQLDATRVAELAVATPASIEATQTITPVVAAIEGTQPQSPAAAEGPSASGAVTPSSDPVTSISSPATTADPQTPPTSSDNSRDGNDDEYEDEYEDEYDDEYEYEDEEDEGSLDDHVHDDSFEIDSPRTLDAVVVSESDS